MARRDHDLRSLCLAVGIGDYNATAIIPYLLMAPAQVDADMPAIMLLVEALQKTMNEMGARLSVTGDLDIATVIELKKLVGPNWLPMKWWEITRRVANARDRGVMLTPGNAPSASRRRDPRLEAMGGTVSYRGHGKGGEVNAVDMRRSLHGDGGDGLGGVFDFLPAVPGGAITYAAGGAALWWFLLGGKKRYGARKGR